MNELVELDTPQDRSEAIIAEPSLSDEFEEKVQIKRRRVARQRYRDAGVSAENYPPKGQAAAWYEEVVHEVSLSGQLVAKQLARLCGDDSLVRITWRSLSEAVSRANAADNKVSTVQSGVKTLIASGWLRKETVGRGSKAITTFYLLPGDVLYRDAGEDLHTQNGLCTKDTTGLSGDVNEGEGEG